MQAIKIKKPVTGRKLIEAIEAYADACGIEVSTACRKIFNDSRFADSLANRDRRNEENLARLQSYVRENPPPTDKK